MTDLINLKNFVILLFLIIFISPNKCNSTGSFEKG